jgi:hypothetical protein
MKQKTFGSARIISLIIRQMLGTIKLDERIELEEWVLASRENEDLYNEIIDPASIKREVDAMPESDVKKNWEKIADLISKGAEKRVIKLEEKGPTAIALKKFLIETKRGYNVIEKPEGVYEFHIIVKDDMDVFMLGAAHGNIYVNSQK